MQDITKRLVVILGAGASHDVINPSEVMIRVKDGELRPPLTKDLFGVRNSLENDYIYFPGVEASLQYVRNKLRDQGASVEKVLASL